MRMVTETVRWLARVALAATLLSAAGILAGPDRVVPQGHRPDGICCGL